MWVQSIGGAAGAKALGREVGMQGSGAERPCELHNETTLFTKENQSCMTSLLKTGWKSGLHCTLSLPTLGIAIL